MENKLMILLAAPVSTRSGYGSRSRDIATALIKSGKYDVRIYPTNWGQTPWTGLDMDNVDHVEISKRLLHTPQLERKPDISIQITIPNEFQQWGVKNIGITAGIETDHVDASWIEGVNRMDLVLVSSEFAKQGFMTTVYDRVDPNNPQVKGPQLKVETPIEVLFEGIDLDIYFKTKVIHTEVENELAKIPEAFAFLFVGTWLNGEIGQDRKDIGMLIKVFCETFKNIKKKPALILKTSISGNSIVDRFEVLKRINGIKESCSSKDLPNIYLLTGDLTDNEMNSLYNHPKIKAHISFTKGEGYGRPILESSISAKPVIVPNHSGYLDFLEFGVKLPGQLTNIHPSAVWQGVLNEGTKWFTVDYGYASGLIKDVYENYDKYTDLGKRQAYRSRTEFNLEKMQNKLIEFLEPISANIPIHTEIKLPALKKITMPALKKVE